MAGTFSHALVSPKEISEMESTRIVKAAIAAISISGLIALVGIKPGPIRAHAQDNGLPAAAQAANSEQAEIAIGWQIAPAFLKTQGKDPALVGLGSFIVNAQADCNGCHTSDPANEYTFTHNPYLLSPPSSPPAAYNQATYLNGGSNFGPVGPGIVLDPNSPLYAGPGLGPNIISRNLTPDFSGNPEGGNDLQTFINILRTGHDFDSLHPMCGGTVTDNCYSAPVNGALLQVMPWPLFRHMTDRQITAIWTYLSTVPCNAHNDALGAMYPWLKNNC
jgi:hypothetical protein